MRICWKSPTCILSLVITVEVYISANDLLFYTKKTGMRVITSQVILRGTLNKLQIWANKSGFSFL